MGYLFDLSLFVFWLIEILKKKKH